MPITRRSRRKMSPTARRIAALHNDAASLARRLKTLAHDVAMLELNLTHEQLDAADRAAFSAAMDEGPTSRRLAKEISAEALAAAGYDRIAGRPDVEKAAKRRRGGRHA